MNNVLNKNKLKLFTNNGSDLLTRLSILENNVYKITYYEIISGASGTLTVPTQATVNGGEFAGLNCILSEVDGSNKPTWVTPKTAGGTVVTSTLNVGTGAWVKSGVTASANVALIYSLDIKAIYYSNLNNAFILEETITPSLDYIISNTTLNSVTSASLAGVMSDETGNGPLVFANSPVLVTPALGTPASGIATNLTGTATGLTAGNVITNANLTGPITSVGNTTAVASQTGTGSTFVMNTSPTLSNPIVGTQVAGDNSTKAASTAYVDTGLATKQNLLGFTPENVANKDTDGTLAANSDTKYASQKATKTYTDTGLALKANLASPTFTGDPKAPTPTAGDNDTSIATTAFVTSAITNNIGLIVAISRSNCKF